MGLGGGCDEPSLGSCPGSGLGFELDVPVVCAGLQALPLWALPPSSLPSLQTCQDAAKDQGCCDAAEDPEDGSGPALLPTHAPGCHHHPSLCPGHVCPASLPTGRSLAGWWVSQSHPGGAVPHMVPHLSLHRWCGTRKPW